ncbi:hypothetical protein PIB30_058858, partial [Stylosanthes scabra]|nr:hypothetical protein [Stylosanthes scabra]
MSTNLDRSQLCGGLDINVIVFLMSLVVVVDDSASHIRERVKETTGYLKRGRFRCHNQGRFGIPFSLKQDVRCSGTRTSYENDIKIVLQQESVTEFGTSLKYR